MLSHEMENPEQGEPAVADVKLRAEAIRKTRMYRERLEKFLRGEVGAAAFRGQRISTGVYDQRTAGLHSVPIRAIGGGLTSRQLEKVAELSEKYGDGVVHVSTQRDLQIRNVRTARTADVLEGMLEAGLSPRGEAGNGARTVTACPRAGLCPQEHFDVMPYATALAEYPLPLGSGDNRVEDLEIVFSGCPEDCGFAGVADLGFFAHVRNGARGFSVYAGGGLGPGPSVAVKLEDFVGEDEIFEVAQAIARLADQRGDCGNSHEAGLRYILAAAGEEEFARLYREERRKVRVERAAGKAPAVRKAGEGPDAAEFPNHQNHIPEFSGPELLPEKTAGLYTVKLMLPLGDIPAEDLTTVARIADSYGMGLVRTTAQQDLLIVSVARTSLGAVRGELHKLSIDICPRGIPEVAACPGASTCRLGVCRARELAGVITEQLSRRPSTKTSAVGIRISGCECSCGQHQIGDIGLEGRALAINGRWMPCYDVVAGGQTKEGSTHLAEKVGTVSAKAVPALLAELFQKDGVDVELLRAMVEKHKASDPAGTPDDAYYDWGSDQPFSLEGCEAECVADNG